MTEPTEMELRVASAINRAAWDEKVALIDGMSLLMARAAIRAMREPTEEMQAAGAAVGKLLVDEGLVPSSTCWVTMIDAASPRHD